MAESMKLPTLITLIGSLCVSVHCLFEDQAGKFDWKEKYVGKLAGLDADNGSSDGDTCLRLVTLATFGIYMCQANIQSVLVDMSCCLSECGTKSPVLWSLNT